ncbi:MAG: hypothetical protein IT449_03090 [Phycisphaerales bacterium]|nr:hypothetical protein [Phycisphaerales bacterium]
MHPRSCPLCLFEMESAANFCPRCGHNLSQAPLEGWVVKGVDLRHVARWQRRLLWYVLAAMLMQCLPAMGPPSLMAKLLDENAIAALLVFLGCVAFLVLILVGVVRMLGALRKPVWMQVLYGVFLLAPCVNLLLLLIANRHATQALRAAGLKVGFMGVPDEQVVRVLSRFNCRQCGYSLIGNLSGRCPECGTPSPFAAMIMPAPSVPPTPL